VLWSEATCSSRGRDVADKAGADRLHGIMVCGWAVTREVYALFAESVLPLVMSLVFSPRRARPLIERRGAALVEGGIVARAILP
jgi:hypothetical protein